MFFYRWFCVCDDEKRCMRALVSGMEGFSSYMQESIHARKIWLGLSFVKAKAVRVPFCARDEESDFRTTDFIILHAKFEENFRTTKGNHPKF